jgi:putative redox protein
MEIEIFFEENKKVNARIKGHVVKTDQPLKDGGDDSAASPFDLFLVSMGTCVGYYVKSFCDQRSIPTDKIKITQNMEYGEERGMIQKINIVIYLPPDFPEKYKEAVFNSANLCKVKKHLLKPPQVNVVLMND